MDFWFRQPCNPGDRTGRKGHGDSVPWSHPGRDVYVPWQSYGSGAERRDRAWSSKYSCPENSALGSGDCQSKLGGRQPQLLCSSYAVDLVSHWCGFFWTLFGTNITASYHTYPENTFVWALFVCFYHRDGGKEDKSLLLLVMLFFRPPGRSWSYSLAKRQGSVFRHPVCVFAARWVDRAEPSYPL